MYQPSRAFSTVPSRHTTWMPERFMGPTASRIAFAPSSRIEGPGTRNRMGSPVVVTVGMPISIHWQGTAAQSKPLT
eukprot:1379552-Rhodomonas_salina.2